MFRKVVAVLKLRLECTLKITERRTKFCSSRKNFCCSFQLAVFEKGLVFSFRESFWIAFTFTKGFSVFLDFERFFRSYVEEKVRILKKIEKTKILTSLT